MPPVLPPVERPSPQQPRPEQVHLAPWLACERGQTEQNTECAHDPAGAAAEVTAKGAEIASLQFILMESTSEQVTRIEREQRRQHHDRGAYPKQDPSQTARPRHLAGLARTSGPRQQAEARTPLTTDPPSVAP